MFEEFTFADGLGVIGSLTLCGAYFAVSSGRASAFHLPYQFLNIAGSALLLVSLYFRPNPGAILIEVIWLLIALWFIVRIMKSR